MNTQISKHKIHKVVRTGLCLFMLSGSCVLSARASVLTADSLKATSSLTKKSSSRTVKRKVSGFIYDAATKKPMAGVRIQALSNRYFSAMSDDKGYYSIAIPDYVTTLYISVADYNALQIPIKGDKLQNVYLYSDKLKNSYPDKTDLYNNQTSTVSNTSALTIEDDIQNNLEGAVHTINRGGMPAQGAIMFINGLNSLNANAQPLIVIDGVLQDMQYGRSALHEGFVNNVFNIVDPEDIATVKVIRNGTALYGARGSNGVIEITTKRGNSMVTHIQIRSFGGFEQSPALLKVMNADQYRNYVTEFLGTVKNADQIGARMLPFMNSDSHYLFYPLYHNNTDWQKNLYHDAFTQNYKVSVEGGDDVAKYNLSLGFAQSDATAKKNDFNRLNIRFNTDVDMFRNLTSAIDIAYARNAYNLRDNGWAENYAERNISSPNVLGLIQAPFISPYAYYVKYNDALAQLQLGHTFKVYSGKNYDSFNNPYTFARPFGFSGYANPYWLLLNGEGNNKNYQEQTQFNLNVAPKYQINKNLYVENRFSYILNRSNEKYYLPNDGTPSKSVDGLGSIRSIIQSQFSKETTLYNDLHVDWKHREGKHYLNVLGGVRFSSYAYSDSHILGYNNDNDKIPNLSYSLQFKQYGGTDDQWMNLAYYLNASYNYKSIYYLDFITNMESSSRFGRKVAGGVRLFGVSWGLFPSLQAGWLMSSEKWFNVPFVNYLKLTAGIEKSGNDNVNYYASRTYFENEKFLDKATALVLGNIQNPKIQWESTTKFNIGLNTNLFNNRLALTIDAFLSKTNHLLTRKTVSDITGLQYTWANDGSLSNKGFYMQLNGVVVNTKNFKWETGFSIGHYRNELTMLPSSSNNVIKNYMLDADGHRIKSSMKAVNGYLSSIYGYDNVLTAVGHPLGVFYGYKTAGVFRDEKEAATAGKYGYLRMPTGIPENPYRNFKAGDVRFVDQNHDGWIDDADKVVIGDPNPAIYGNLYTRASWKNLSLDVIFKYSLGNDIYNYQRSQLEAANSIYNQTTAVVNRWRYNGQDTNMPRTIAPSSADWVNNERFSDRWIEDGSYLKLKKIRITYTIPVNLSWLQGLSVWGEANNLVTLTKYLGTDPEVSVADGVLYQGVDAGYLPLSRSFNLGLTVNL